MTTALTQFCRFHKGRPGCDAAAVRTSEPEAAMNLGITAHDMPPPKAARRTATLELQVAIMMIYPEGL